MTQKNIHRIHLIYGIVTGAVAVLAGICLIAACCNIYYAGVAAGASQIYTRQIVAESFGKIAIPVYTCLILVLGGIVLNLLLPQEKAKLKPEKNLPLILSRLKEKTDLKNCDINLRGALAQQQKRRKSLVWFSGVFLAIWFVRFLVYACNPDHWAANSTPSMVTAVMVMLGYLIIPLLVTVWAAYQHRKSMKKEIELMKEAAAQAPRTVEPAPAKKTNNKVATIIRIGLIAAGVLLVVLGACNEGTKDILTKAVNICTECVGLG